MLYNILILICYILETVPPPEQLKVVHQLIEFGVKTGKISKDYKLLGHRQIKPTECPGSALFEEISHWDHFIKNYSPITTTTAKPSNKESNTPKTNSGASVVNNYYFYYFNTPNSSAKSFLFNLLLMVPLVLGYGTKYMYLY